MYVSNAVAVRKNVLLVVPRAVISIDIDNCERPLVQLSVEEATVKLA